MDHFDRYCEAAVLDMILSVMPKDIPSLRELKIQNHKLQRMVTTPRDKRTSWDMLAGKVSLKKWKKGEQKRALEIAAQTKKVRILSDTVFKEFLRCGDPSLTNVKFQTWKREVDGAIKEGAEKLKNQARQLPPKPSIRRRTSQLSN